MDPGAARDVLTVASGVVSGVLSGMFGVGGTVVSTPAIRALGASAIAAVGTTLPSVIPGAVSGTLRYQREQLVDWRLVAAIAPLGMAASVIGSLASSHVPGNGHLLMIATAALLAVSAWRMVRPSAGSIGSTDPGAHGRTGSPRRGVVASGVTAGLLSGLLGIGGGVLLVPTFHQLAGRPLKSALATSLACVALFAIPGTITHAVLGQIDWRFALLLAIGVVPGAQLGATIAIRARDQRLQVAVGVFLGLVAVVFAAGEVAAMVG
jgi:uncharacterized membrane protein YfcA